MSQGEYIYFFFANHSLEACTEVIIFQGLVYKFGVIPP